LRLTISQSESERLDQAANASFVSTLTHELGMCLKDWCGSSAPVLHWMYRHEWDETLQRTRLLLSVPEAHVAAALRWLNRKFIVKASKACDFKIQIDCRPGMSQESQVRFHWQSVRSLLCAYHRQKDPARHLSQRPSSARGHLDFISHHKANPSLSN
jgi:DNA polymerase III subunit gamma/tau